MCPWIEMKGGGSTGTGRTRGCVQEAVQWGWASGLAFFAYVNLVRYEGIMNNVAEKIMTCFVVF